jgi:hypothetical protein
MNFTIINIEFLKTWYFPEYRNLESLSVEPSFSTPQKRSTWNPKFFFTRVFHSAALGGHGPFDRLVSTAVAAENGHLPTCFL